MLCADAGVAKRQKRPAFRIIAPVAELAYAYGLEPYPARVGGSNPPGSTKLFSPPPMKGPMNFFELTIGEMRIDLSSRHVRVT